MKKDQPLMCMESHVGDQVGRGPHHSSGPAKCPLSKSINGEGPTISVHGIIHVGDQVGRGPHYGVEVGHGHAHCGRV